MKVCLIFCIVTSMVLSMFYPQLNANIAMEEELEKLLDTDEDLGDMAQFPQNCRSCGTACGFLCGTKRYRLCCYRFFRKRRSEGSPQPGELIGSKNVMGYDPLGLGVGRSGHPQDEPKGFAAR